MQGGANRESSGNDGRVFFLAFVRLCVCTPQQWLVGTFVCFCQSTDTGCACDGGARQLINGLTLHDQNVDRETTIYLVLRLRGGPELDLEDDFDEDDAGDECCALYDEECESEEEDDDNEVGAGADPTSTRGANEGEAGGEADGGGGGEKVADGDPESGERDIGSDGAGAGHGGGGPSAEIVDYTALPSRLNASFAAHDVSVFFDCV